MSTTTQRPTPDTDEAEINLGSACGQFSEWYVKPDFARKIERERDEVREQLEAMRNERDQLSRDLSSLLAGDCLNGHDAVEGVRNGIAMREAIKDAHYALAYVYNHGEGSCAFPFRTEDDLCSENRFHHVKDALDALQPFLKP